MPALEINDQSAVSNVKACVFDVFGTVVDWRTSIAADLAAFGRAKGIEADWIKFTDGMVESAKKVLVASKTKNQENVSDSTNDLNDACQNCHRVYRGPTRCVAPMP